MAQTVKASALNAGDLGSNPGSERSSGEGNGNPFQYSCLENFMDGEAWWAIVHGVTKSWTWLSNFTLSLFKPSWILKSNWDLVVLLKEYKKKKRQMEQIMCKFPIRKDSLDYVAVTNNCKISVAFNNKNWFLVHPTFALWVGYGFSLSPFLSSVLVRKD